MKDKWNEIFNENNGVLTKIKYKLFAKKTVEN